MFTNPVCTYVKNDILFSKCYFRIIMFIQESIFVKWLIFSPWHQSYFLKTYLKAPATSPATRTSRKRHEHTFASWTIQICPPKGWILGGTTFNVIYKNSSSCRKKLGIRMVENSFIHYIYIVQNALGHFIVTNTYCIWKIVTVFTDYLVEKL